MTALGEPEWFFDIEQGTAEWYELRRGIPTASEFQTILVRGQGAQTYMNRLAGELLCKRPAEQTWSRPWLDRGKEMEGEARDEFARRRMLELNRVGFVRRKLPSGRYVGASPDAIWTNSLLEIKTMQPEKMIAVKRNGYNPNAIPNEHKAQVMGGLWVTGFTHADLIVYYSGMPWSLEYSAPRDGPYILDLEKAVIAFDRELDALVKSLGG